MNVEVDFAGTARGRVLVVEDSSSNRQKLVQLVQFLGAEAHSAGTGQEALERVGKEDFDLILLDLELPDMDGREVLKKCKSSVDSRSMPIITICGQDETDMAVECISSGAEDYVTRPFQPVLLYTRIRATLERRHLLDRERERQQELVAIKQELTQSQEDLRKANLLLADAAYTDVVTGIPNRHAALQSLRQIWAQSNRNDRALTCLMIDIDEFHTFNERYGPEVGDLVLRDIASTIRTVIRTSDVVGRFGGEEFVVLCPDSDAQAGTICAERIMTAVRARSVAQNGQPLQVTISIGVAERGMAILEPEELLRLADEALRAAKQGGRNRIVVAS